MQIIQGKEAVELRELYAETFLDTQGERYQRYVTSSAMNYPKGLMWDCLPLSPNKKYSPPARSDKLCAGGVLYCRKTKPNRKEV